MLVPSGKVTRPDPWISTKNRSIGSAAQAISRLLVRKRPVLDLRTSEIRGAGPRLIEPATPVGAVWTSAADEIARHHVDRRVAGLRNARALNFRLVIAGREGLSVADPHPVETVFEESGRLLRSEARCLGAKRRPILALREARLVLPANKGRTRGPECRQRALGPFVVDRGCRRNQGNSRSKGVGGWWRWNRHGRWCRRRRRSNGGRRLDGAGREQQG